MWCSADAVVSVHQTLDRVKSVGLGGVVGLSYPVCGLVAGMCRVAGYPSNLRFLVIGIQRAMA